MTLLNSAPPWAPPRSDTVTLFHGCLVRHAASIRKRGILTTTGRADADFGQGFYTTTFQRQAEHWAFFCFSQVESPGPHDQPVVLSFEVSRTKLARLNWLAFTSAHYSSEDYWSFVQHMRRSPAGARMHNHRHPDPTRDGWYDVVAGPVAAMWTQRLAMPDSNQISFHTLRAAAVLNGVIRRGGPGFRTDPVPLPPPEPILPPSP